MNPSPSVNQVLAAYRKWVMENPTRATEIETMIKWISYFAAGKINNSPIFSEFIYSASNIFSMYNDILIKRSQTRSDYHRTTAKERLKLWLTVLHYCEVFVEIASRNKWGTRGKWSSATVIQIIRCISNLVLIHKFNEIPVQQPPIPVLQRENVNRNSTQEIDNGGFVLKRSGRVIRRVEAAPPTSLRDWRPLPSLTIDSGDIERKKLAETLYVLKPLIHLGSIACFGSQTWKQWLIFMSLDLASLKLYSEEMNSLDYEQRLEIYRRKLSLLFYLLRSPMYQKYSSSYIHRFLGGLSRNIPLMRFVCNPILQYISHWQDTYFYMWPN